MKKIISTVSGALLLAASSTMTSCVYIPKDITPEKIEEKISAIQSITIAGIQEALEQPIVVVSQTGDTIVSYIPDSIPEETAIRKIMIHVDEQHNDNQPSVFERQRQMYMVMSAILIPCITLLLIVCAILIFIFFRTRSRNALIAKAIENGVELPEGFYTGQNTTRIIYQNDTTPRATQSDTGTDNNANRYDMPPIPNIKQNNALERGIRLTVIGFCLLIFFIFVDAGEAGILAGGIPMLLGIGRIGSWYYQNKHN